MPGVVAANKVRSCLVCERGKTNVAHMGIDVCRACTVFYRRSKTKKYFCSSNSNECPIGSEGVNCRKCRFDHIKRVLTESGALDQEKTIGSEDCEGNDPSCSAGGKSDKVQSDPFFSTPIKRPIIARLKTHYTTMCEFRFFSELNLMPDPPHPMQMKNLKNVFYPATFTSINVSNRVFLSAVMPFASSSFPEFDNFGDAEQWAIIMNFFFRFRHIESAYRADSAFPEQMDRTLGGYTTYMAGENADNFFSDCPNPNLNLKDARRLMLEKSKTVWMKARKFMSRLKPDLDEFLAIVGIMFWTIEDQSVSEEVTHLSEQYRSEILQELHVYYRDELGVNDYAARLGELLTLIQFFEKGGDMKEFFELLRIMNVFSDDTFAYRLIKE